MRSHDVSIISSLKETSATREDLSIGATTAPQLIASNNTDTNKRRRNVESVDDRKAVIYTWDEERVNSKDIFTAFMDSSLTISQRDPLVLSSSLDAVSTGGICAIFVHLARGPTSMSNSLVEKLLI